MWRLILLFLLLGFSNFVNGQQKLPLTLENIWSGFFDQKDIKPQVMNTQPAVAFIRADKVTNFEGILTLDMVSGKIIDTVFSNQTKLEKNSLPITFTFFEDFTFSPDDSKIIIRSEKQNIYHTSHKEFVFIWDDSKKTLKTLSTDGKVSAAIFSPDGKKISFVRDANIYLKDLETDKITSVTTDGATGSIINGIADEVYEDGFGLHKMYAWNAQGTKIAFVKINQNYVKRIPISNYERSEIQIQQNVYAKAGENISEAQVYIYDIANNNFTKLELGTNPNQYIVNFKWNPTGDNILVERLNRSQTTLEVVKCNGINGKFEKIILTETQKPFVKTNLDNIQFVSNTNDFLWLSEKDGYNHIYYNNAVTNVLTQLTKGKFEVKSIECIDVINDKIFFMSNMENTMQNHLCSVSLNGKNQTKITQQNAWHNTIISADNKYFFDKYSTLNAPLTYRIYKTTGQEVTNNAIIENKIFKEKIKEYNFVDAKTFTVNNSKGLPLNGWILQNNTVGDKKKPLLFYIYGSNNKQEVTEEWTNRMAMTFRYYANLGFVVACIDPTGTPGKGVAFRSNTGESLETNAINDIENVKNYLIKNYNINANKTTLMGWSYGGFLTAIAATKYAGLFHKYIAIAPVTNWRDYAAAYTERLLQTPSDNPDGFKKTKPEEYIANYKGGLLLIHGSSDDNVHLQHTMKLAKALTESDNYYDIQIFTDKGHTLSDGDLDKTRMNLFKKITKFLQHPDMN